MQFKQSIITLKCQIRVLLYLKKIMILILSPNLSAYTSDIEKKIYRYGR